jgi:hypothetical protein
MEWLSHLVWPLAMPSKRAESCYRQSVIMLRQINGHLVTPSGHRSFSVRTTPNPLWVLVCGMDLGATDGSLFRLMIDALGAVPFVREAASILEGLRRAIQFHKQDPDIGIADRCYRRFETPGLTYQTGSLLYACCISSRSFASLGAGNSCWRSSAPGRALKGKVVHG